MEDFQLVFSFKGKFPYKTRAIFSCIWTLCENPYFQHTIISFLQLGRIPGIKQPSPLQWHTHCREEHVRIDWSRRESLRKRTRKHKYFTLSYYHQVVFRGTTNYPNTKQSANTNCSYVLSVHYMPELTIETNIKKWAKVKWHLIFWSSKMPHEHTKQWISHKEPHQMKQGFTSCWAICAACL